MQHAKMGTTLPAAQMIITTTTASPQPSQHHHHQHHHPEKRLLSLMHYLWLRPAKYPRFLGPFIDFRSLNDGALSGFQ